MLLIVTMSDLFFLMLGWDGLGLVSFFLIVYYQNATSIFSGLVTLLINRVGDAFFLVTISLFFYNYPTLFSHSSHMSRGLVVLMLTLTFITKRAIYPFSPWLPLAIAAPTPISALVHSSTLVTAGLYLIIRYSYILYSSYYFMKLLLVLSIFTSFYAGINAVFEVDLKKLIALSTLSHLGFIGIAFSSGLVHLAFFHLLAHALFKSLLFITIGDIIINLNHSQDIRYLSSGITYTPVSCAIMYVSLFNLLGLPNVRGFFSKDLILEMINFSNVGVTRVFLIYVNVVFTYFYTFQLFYYSFQYNKVVSYQVFHALSPLHTSLLLFMGFITLGYGFYFLKSVFSSMIFYPLPGFIKFYPPLLIISMFFRLYLSKKQVLIRQSLLSFYFSNMIYLSNVTITVMSNFYYEHIFPLVRSIELGALNHVANSYLSSFYSLVSLSATKLSTLPPMKTLLFTLWFIIVFYLVVLSSNINNYMWLLPTISHHELDIYIN